MLFGSAPGNHLARCTFGDFWSLGLSATNVFYMQHLLVNILLIWCALHWINVLFALMVCICTCIRSCTSESNYQNAWGQQIFLRSNTTTYFNLCSVWACCIEFACVFVCVFTSVLVYVSVFVVALQNLITQMLQASKSFCDPTPLIPTFVLSERVALDQDFVTKQTWLTCWLSLQPFVALACQTQRPFERNLIRSKLRPFLSVPFFIFCVALDQDFVTTT